MRTGAAVAVLLASAGLKNEGQVADLAAFLKPFDAQGEKATN